MSKSILKEYLGDHYDLFMAKERAQMMDTMFAPSIIDLIVYPNRYKNMHDKYLKVHKENWDKVEEELNKLKGKTNV